MTLAEAIHSLYPEASSFFDYRVIDRLDGNGQQLEYWNEEKLGPQPTQEEIDNAPPLLPIPKLTSVGLCRFTATAPISVVENVGLGPVTRIVKGRYRAGFNAALPTSEYSVIPAVKDPLPRVVRVTARTASYCEVRVTDILGVAQDAEEVTIKIERVVST